MCKRPKIKPSIIFAFLTASLAQTVQGSLSNFSVPKTLAQKSANLVEEPDYEAEDSALESDSDGPKPKQDAEKLQYEPVTDEKPLLQTRKSKIEASSGALYEEGSDLFVVPESDFTIKEEKIEERPEPPEQKAVDPEISQIR